MAVKVSAEKNIFSICSRHSLAQNISQIQCCQIKQHLLLQSFEISALKFLGLLRMRFGY